MRGYQSKFTLFLLFISLALFFSSFNKQVSTCENTNDGYAINWQNSLKLKQSDFKANKKWSSSTSAANTYSGFGYSITDNNGNISGSIFVRFYCDKSWFNPDINEPDKINYLLKHEQLHFDICELFGRKLYREVQVLIKKNKLNQKSINHAQSKLEKQYSDYQKAYDKETNHSINIAEQHKWDKKVKKELAKLSRYTDYKYF